MSSVIIDSSKQAFDSIPIGDKIDFLDPPRLASPIAPVSRQKVKVPIIGTPDFGQSFILQVPQMGWVLDPCLEFSGTFASGEQATSYMGLSAISKIKITCGSYSREYDYNAVMAWLMTKMDRSRIDDLLKAAGGSGTADKESGFCCPIPCFFSSWISDSPSVPLFVEALSSPVQIEVTLRTAAQMTDAGDTAMTNLGVKAWIFQYNTTAAHKKEHLSKPYVYPSIEWQTLVDQTCAATSTSYDISAFKGVLSNICAVHQTVANKTTAHDYWDFSEISQFDIYVDGHKLWTLRSSTSEEGILDTFLASQTDAKSGQVQVGASGYVYVASWGAPGHASSVLKGGVDTRRTQEMTVDVTGVASSLISFVCEKPILFHIREGDFSAVLV